MSDQNIPKVIHDDQVAAYIAGEEQRERDGLELIPSENYVSRDVLTALGSILRTNTLKATLASATTAARTLRIKLNSWRLIAQKYFFTLITPMCNHTQAHRRTKLSTAPG